jgi:hypothetical protein
LKIGVGENICVDGFVDEKPLPKRQGSRRRGEVPSKSNSKATDEKKGVASRTASPKVKLLMRSLKGEVAQ